MNGRRTASGVAIPVTIQFGYTILAHDIVVQALLSPPLTP